MRPLSDDERGILDEIEQGAYAAECRWAEQNPPTDDERQAGQAAAQAVIDAEFDRLNAEARQRREPMAEVVDDGSEPF